MSKFNFSGLKSNKDTGFGDNFSGRFIDKNGYPNVQKRGVGILNRYSWYHTMLNLPRWQFIALLISGYIVINFIFAMIYFLIGVEHLTGINRSSLMDEFTDVFFFSTQTFTTVGYGRIAPVGFLASLVATFEAFLGLLGFAIATGLFFGRFSRPRAFLKFSDVALISPYKDRSGLMFRMAPFKNTSLTDASITVLASFEITENGETKSSFYNLKLEVTTITSLILNWTIVHYIDEQSPFYGLSSDDLKTIAIEIIVHVKAFDSIFSSDVVQRTSYTSQEIIYGAKFEKMYNPDETNLFTVLHLDKINSYFPASLPDIS
ncbi:MAG: ion channel [Weeksellaceae bacterium]|nr:ion channel [Weeksellaceae bacterium]